MSDWAVFWVVMATAITVDFLFSRKSTTRGAALWSAIWIGLGLAFGAFIFVRQGSDAGINYLTAYLLEKSLSVDNLFVFILIFSVTGIPAHLQHRALFWGIVGALAMRAVLIGVGVELLERFHWMVYPLAALLGYSALRMLTGAEAQARYVEKGCAVCTSWVAKIVPIEPQLQGSRFFVRRHGALMATPLLVALAMIESTDLIFAVDSIPAVLSVTRDPFLVYTSNVFALLGLRSLYFLVANAIRTLRFLRPGLAIMLFLAAAKLVLSEVMHVPPLVSLAAIVVIFSVAIAASLLLPEKPAATTPCTHADGLPEVGPASDGCQECVKQGDSWVHLRMCLTCGHVGCCDSSRNRHATAHYHASGHPVIRSLEKGESWKWCYVDKAMLP